MIYSALFYHLLLSLWPLDHARGAFIVSYDGSVIVYQNVFIFPIEKRKTP